MICVLIDLCELPYTCLGAVRRAPYLQIVINTYRLGMQQSSINSSPKSWTTGKTQVSHVKCPLLPGAHFASQGFPHGPRFLQKNNFPQGRSFALHITTVQLNVPSLASKVCAPLQQGERMWSRGLTRTGKWGPVCLSSYAEVVACGKFTESAVICAFMPQFVVHSAVTCGRLHFLNSVLCAAERVQGA